MNSPLRLIFLPTLACLLAAPALAQTASTPIRVGQAVSGTLAPGDALADDDTFYDDYTFETAEPARFRVTMRSADFDAYLSVGRIENGAYHHIASDDDSAGGTDARLVFVAPSPGTYRIRANALSEGETGAYTLMLEALPWTPRHTLESARPIAAGATVTGRLEESDPLLEDFSHYHWWVYQGRAGETLTLTMRSEDFDTFLAFGQVRNGAFDSLETDDDGAGGTDSRITTTLPADGLYVIQANSLSAGSTGAYTLQLEARR
jgi:hypothetical protein